MSVKLKNLVKSQAFMTGAICFWLAFVSLIYFIVKGQGFFYLTNDFVDQQIPFTASLHQAIFDGGLSGFSWDVDLGTSTLNGFGFYEVGSPFFWITMLFPVAAFPYIVGWLFMLKYVAAGVISYFYLKRFVKDGRLAMLGAVLYAFSGFSLMNMLYYHFHEVVAFFPLMLIGLEKYKEDNDKRLLIFSIFVNGVINYYFFVAEAIFLVCYFIFRFFNKDLKVFFKDVLNCLVCGIWGVAIALFQFLPNVIYVSGNPRTDNNYTLVTMLTTSLKEYMYILKGLLLPAEAMTSISAVYEQHFYSHAMYLPMVGLCLVFAYLVKNRDWLSRFVIFLFVACFVPFFSEGFFLFTSSQMRWWFMMVLMFVLASIRFIEEPETKSMKIGAGVNIALVLGFYLVINLLQKYQRQENWIFHSKRLIMLTAASLIGVVLTSLFVLVFKCNFKLLLAGVSAFAVAFTFITVHVYRATERWMTFEQYKNLWQASLQLELPDDQYRLNDTYNLTSMTAHVPGFSDQSSTDTNTIRDFEDLFDFYNECAAINKNQYPGLHELLAGKYFLAYDPSVGNVIETYDDGTQPVYLMEGSACPLGFAVDSYITEDELRKLPVENRALALLDSAVLRDEDITKELDADLEEQTAATVDVEKSAEEYVEEKTAASVGDFTLNGKGITCTSDYEKDTYVYFAVPYDTGWTARVDGVKTQTIYSGGMFMIKVPAGHHDIRLSYMTPWYLPSIIVSWIAGILFVIFAISYKKNKSQKDL